MSEFFKSAMGYFNTNPSTNPGAPTTASQPNSGGSSNSGVINANTFKTSSSSLQRDNDFCGQIVEINGHKLRVKRVIAEGWLHQNNIVPLNYSSYVNTQTNRHRNLKV